MPHLAMRRRQGKDVLPMYLDRDDGKKRKRGGWVVFLGLLVIALVVGAVVVKQMVKPEEEEKEDGKCGRCMTGLGYLLSHGCPP